MKAAKHRDQLEQFHPFHLEQAPNCAFKIGNVILPSSSWSIDWSFSICSCKQGLYRKYLLTWPNYLSSSLMI